MSTSDIPEPGEDFYIRCAKARAVQLGKRATESSLAGVSQRPWFRKTCLWAYNEGYMDRTIHAEEERWNRAQRKS